MAMTRAARPLTAVALAALFAGCGPPGERAVDVEAAPDDDMPVPGEAAEHVRTLTTLRDTLDKDDDGFVSPAEAEGYYRPYFQELDDNNDGRLSRAELKPEAPGTPAPEVASEELIGAPEQEYVDDRLRRYNLSADHTIGMMSTRDFDEMVGTSDPVVSDPRPGTALP